MTRPVQAILAVAIVCAMTVATAHRSRVWSSEVALWQDAVSKSPMKPRPRINLALALYRSGDSTAALGEYQNALRVSIVRPEQERMMARQYVATNMSQIFMNTQQPGSLAVAERILTQAWNEYPGSPVVAVNLAEVWTQTGRAKMAVELIDMALGQVDSYPWFRDSNRLLFNRAMARMVLKDCAGAREDIRLSKLKVPEVKCEP